MAKKKTMGTCPKCGEDNAVEYLDHEFVGESIAYLCYCNDCHIYFKEWEVLQYAGYSIIKENGEEVQFDEEGEEV